MKEKDEDFKRRAAEADAMLKGALEEIDDMHQVRLSPVLTQVAPGVYQSINRWNDSTEIRKKEDEAREKKKQEEEAKVLADSGADGSVGPATSIQEPVIVENTGS